jgi:thermitase
MRGWLAGLLVLAGLLAEGAVWGQTYVPDELLVKFRPGTSTQARNIVHRALGVVVRDRVPALDVEVVGLPPGLTPARAAAAYARNVAVQYTERNTICVPTGVPSDPGFPQEWGLTKIQAPQAWDVTQGSAGVTIAILDSGIAQEHEDLSTKIVGNQIFSASGTEDDRYGHGTHLAGIAAAITDNGIGIAGVGFRCSLLNVKTAQDDGRSASSVVAKGITWAADSGADVICMGFGSPQPSQAVEDAVNYAWTRGAVLVASAGESGSAAPNYPAAYEHCIAVAATDPGDQKTGTSGFGPWVDVAAPGVGIYSTLPNQSNHFGQQGYGSGSGTSHATAFVAGLAGLVRGSPFGTSNAAVRAHIEATCDRIPGTGQFWTHGRINAARAVGAIQ